MADVALFSQPIQMDYMSNTQGVTPSEQFEPFSEQLFSRIHRQTTRFIVTDHDLRNTTNKIIAALDSLGCTWILNHIKCITAQARDTHNQMIDFKIHMYCPKNGKILIDIRRSRGDGLEFKRIMNKLRTKITELIPNAI
ncbi:Serine/threonine-protein kinase Chk1 [Thelohanellus kitauei]|uniref:Serine/threonine-protein kinase Chk1 n=1 Tax=Thelohanellus kitauei TaxID=669202 RepID=A0A0C2JEK0_THEKT|nr:Serine/threonine-protein kinase Chk1 [Thelohanellus kitauei]